MFCPKNNLLDNKVVQNIWRLNANAVTLLRFINTIKKLHTMNTKRYIKVFPKGRVDSVILLASNKDFYLAQGARIEDPTEEEILQAFPELKAKVEEQKTIAELEKKIESLTIENSKLKAELKKAKQSTNE